MTGFAERTFAEQIKEQLRSIECEEDVKIVYACEAGSRASGLASRDSDYDVRFIYVRRVEWYLSILEKRDVIERPVSERLDIHGWDLKKALNLLRKSNPSLFEWLQSPICYMENHPLVEQIRRCSARFFSPRTSLHHYISMANRNFRAFEQSGQTDIKLCINVLRPLLTCRWIEQTGFMPPMDLERLAEELITEPETKQLVCALIRQKRGGTASAGGPPACRQQADNQQVDNPPACGLQVGKPQAEKQPQEAALHSSTLPDKGAFDIASPGTPSAAGALQLAKGMMPLTAYLKKEIAKLEQAARNAPDPHKPQDEILDELFRQVLQEVWR